MATRLIEFRHKGKFLAAVREIPKDIGIYAVQPDMVQLQAAFPRSWRNAQLQVWYVQAKDDPAEYDYVVDVRLKTVTHFLRGTGYWFK